MTDIVVLGLELFGILAVLFALDRTWDRNEEPFKEREEEHTEREI